jgi:hypothetical protein
MKLISIDTGHFKLDGGAMFGVVPKTIWEKMIPADDHNLCSFLLIQEIKKFSSTQVWATNRTNDFSVIITFMANTH